MLHRLGSPTIKNPAKSIGTDATMNDYSKVLRVPGFRHISKGSYVFACEENDIPNYTLDDLFTLTNAQAYLDYEEEQSFLRSDEPVEIPSLDPSLPKLKAGERFQALQTLSMHLANTTEQEEAYNTFYYFIRDRLDNPDNTYLDLS